MPFDPTEVRSRDELLMGAIATGDSTVIGDPRDRNEEFIKAIADGIGGAASTIYRHRLIVRGTIESYTMSFQVDFLNHNSEDYADIVAAAADIDHLVDFHYVTGSVSNVPGIAFHRVYAHGAGLKISYTYIQQNADTKVINGVSSNAELTLISQLTIPV